jgi:hypothetical protein
VEEISVLEPLELCCRDCYLKEVQGEVENTDFNKKEGKSGKWCFWVSELGLWIVKRW